MLRLKSRRRLVLCGLVVLASLLLSACSEVGQEAASTPATTALTTTSPTVTASPTSSNTLLPQIEAAEQKWRQAKLKSYRLTFSGGRGSGTDRQYKAEVVEGKILTSAVTCTVIEKNCPKSLEAGLGSKVLPVETLFQLARQSLARTSEPNLDWQVYLTFDPTYGYPTEIRGQTSRGLDSDESWRVEEFNLLAAFYPTDDKGQPAGRETNPAKATAPASDPDFMQTLTEAEQKWQRAAITDYTIYVSINDNFNHNPAWQIVQIRDNKLDVKQGDTCSSPQYKLDICTVPNLFDQIRQRAADKCQYLVVEYNSQYGYPVSISTGSMCATDSATIWKVEYFYNYNVSNTPPTPAPLLTQTRQLEQLAQAEQRWQKLGIANYRIKSSSNFAMAYSSSSDSLTVRNNQIEGQTSKCADVPYGSIKNYVPELQCPSHLTVAELFRLARLLVNSEKVVITFSFDPTYSFPNHIYLTGRGITDLYTRWEVDWFEPLTSSSGSNALPTFIGQSQNNLTNEVAYRAKSWQLYRILNYRVTVSLSRNNAATQYFNLTVKDGTITEHWASCTPSPNQTGACQVEPYSPEDYRMESLFQTAYQTANSLWPSGTELSVAVEPGNGYFYSVSVANPGRPELNARLKVENYENLEPKK